MGVYAILCENTMAESGIQVCTHTAVIMNGYQEPPVMTFVYQKRRQEKSGPEIVPFNDIGKFLEAIIPKNYEVFVCDSYQQKYGQMLKDLSHRFLVRDITEFPSSKREELIKALNKSKNAADIESKKCLDMILTDTKGK